MTMGKDFIQRRRQDESIACSRDQNRLKSYPSTNGVHRDALGVEFSRVIKAVQEDAESQRLTRHTLGEIFDKLSSELSKALGLLSLSVSDTDAPAVFKLLYVHVVNLVGSMLNSILSKAVVCSPNLQARFKIRFLEDGFYLGSHGSEREILSEERGFSGGIASSLNLKSFCNVQYLLIDIFGARLEMLNFTAIDRIFAKRDDLLVRHGRNTEDQPVQVTAEEVKLVIATLRDFAVDLNISIYHSLFDNNSSGT
ncbi:hypothetical protein D3C76_345440 [compost metagenome]